MTNTTCVFCAIIDGTSDAHIVLRTPTVVAFLDHRPLFKGHTLVVPTSHHRTLADLPPEALQEVMAHAARLSAVIPRAVDAQGTFVAINNIVSQSVPHLHVHVAPRTKGDGLRGFFWPRTKYDNANDAADYATRIRTQLSND